MRSAEDFFPHLNHDLNLDGFCKAGCPKCREVDGARAYARERTELYQKIIELANKYQVAIEEMVNGPDFLAPGQRDPSEICDELQEELFAALRALPKEVP